MSRKHPKNFLEDDASKEQRRERLEELRDTDFDKTDVLAMILAALKTFLPAILGICLGMILLSSCVVQWWR